MDVNEDGKRTYRQAFAQESASPRAQKKAAVPKTPRRSRVRSLGTSKASASVALPPSASKLGTPRAKPDRVKLVDSNTTARTRERNEALGSKGTTLKPPTTPTSSFSPLNFLGHAVQFFNTGISPLLGRGEYSECSRDDALPLPPKGGQSPTREAPRRSVLDAHSRAASPTPEANTSWWQSSNADEYTPQDLPEVAANDAFKNGAKRILNVAKAAADFSRKHAIVGWLQERREESLLEVMRLDATPAEDEPCTTCVLAGKLGPVAGAEAGGGSGGEGRDALEDAEQGERQGEPEDPRQFTVGGKAREAGGLDGDGAAEVSREDPSLQPGRALFRCEDCRFALLCQKCVVREYMLTPFHRVEMVNERFWERVERKADIGITVQLVHHLDDKCIWPKVVNNFSVMHTNGIHRMTMKFCQCRIGGHLDAHTQLLRARLWPATIDNPQTATTFEAMDDFNRLSMLGRLTAYDYYKSMVACADAMGLLKISSLLKQFTRGAHQFRHIYMFKRAGRAYEGGIYSSPPGSCAIECPACAREGVNMKEDHKNGPNAWADDRQICVDANFRLANKFNRSNDDTDPSLTDGRAYVVSSGEFTRYCDDMEKNPKKEKARPSDCSEFGAMKFANARGGRFMRSTGVAGVFCARHDMILPQAMGQLKVGERYSVVDFCVANAHRFINVEKVAISYDIACQWSKNLISRMEAVDPKYERMFEGAQSLLGKTLEFVVPKFHLFTHKVKCWFSRYNLAFLRFAGQTDGEGCERFWSQANQAAASVREMGPGSVRDMFDSMWDAWNFGKVRDMGNLTLKKLDHALVQAIQMLEEYNDMRDMMRAENAQMVDSWEGRTEKWEAGGRVGECPYQIISPDVSLSALKRRVAEEDAREVLPATLRKLMAEGEGEEASEDGKSDEDKLEAESQEEESEVPEEELEVPEADASDEESEEDASDEESEEDASEEESEEDASEEEGGDPEVDGDASGHEGEGAAKVDAAKEGETLVKRKNYASGARVVLSSGYDKVATGELLRWVLLGVNIEDTRQRLAAGLPDDDGTVNVARMGEDALLERLEQFRKEQERWMPETFHNLTPEERAPNIKNVHKVSLHLPSYLGKKDAPAPKAVADMEAQVRLAHMDGALEELKRFLNLRVQFNKFKIRHITGQNMNTTARSSQATTEKRITMASGKYSRHRAAYRALVGSGKRKGGWETRFQKLKCGDCVGLGDSAIKELESMEQGRARKILRDHARGVRRKLGEVKGKKASSGTNRAHVSWIWYNVGDMDESEGLNMSEDLMVELLKARARAQRWIEQVIRLRAEFDRLIETDLHDARVWEERAKKWELCPLEDFNMRRPVGEAGKPNAPRDNLGIYDGDKVLIAGLCAYAYKQAHYRRKRAEANTGLRQQKARTGDRLLAKYGVDGRLKS